MSAEEVPTVCSVTHAQGHRRKASQACADSSYGDPGVKENKAHLPQLTGLTSSPPRPAHMKAAMLKLPVEPFPQDSGHQPVVPEV